VGNNRIIEQPRRNPSTPPHGRLAVAVVSPKLLSSSSPPTHPLCRPDCATFRLRIKRIIWCYRECITQQIYRSHTCRTYYLTTPSHGSLVVLLRMNHLANPPKVVGGNHIVCKRSPSWNPNKSTPVLAPQAPSPPAASSLSTSRDHLRKVLS
jgi:hypothetical protein